MSRRRIVLEIVLLASVLVLGLFLWTPGDGSPPPPAATPDPEAAPSSAPALLGAGGPGPKGPPPLEKLPPKPPRRTAAEEAEGLPVAGVVLDQTGKPVWRHLRVTITGTRAGGKYDGHPYSRTTETKERGAFRFEDVPPGEVKVHVSSRAPLDGASRAVHARAGDVDVEVVLGPHAAVKLLVSDAETGAAPKTTLLTVHEWKDGSESLVSTTAWPRSASAGAPWESGSMEGAPGSKRVYEVRAQGYAPSGRIEVELVAGVRTVRVALTPAPEQTARLELIVRTSEPDPPKRLLVTHVLGNSRLGHYEDVQRERLVLEVPPGKRTISIGGDTRLTDPDSYWVRVNLELDLAPGETRRQEIWMRRGGYLLLTGRTASPPREVTFEGGGETITVASAFSGGRDAKGLLLGPVPPGSWSFRFGNARTAWRGQAEIEAGGLVRVAAESLARHDLDPSK